MFEVNFFFNWNVVIGVYFKEFGGIVFEESIFEVIVNLIEDGWLIFYIV